LGRSFPFRHVAKAERKPTLMALKLKTRSMRGGAPASCRKERKKAVTAHISMSAAMPVPTA